MKPNAVGFLVVGLLVFVAGTPLVAAEVTQTTGSGSWCSPAQNGNGNIVICNGVDPRAMDRLNELLDRKDLDLKQKTAEANDWAQRYNELNGQLEDTKKLLAARGEDATLVQTAQGLLHEGKLEAAHAIFDRLIQSDEANVDRAAQDHFGRASVFALQFHLDLALPDYAEAYRYRPSDQHYAKAYAYALHQERDYPRAELVLREELRQLRGVTGQNPAYQPDLAEILNNSGMLYGEMHRFSDAEDALREAVDIERNLAAQNPGVYQPNLGTTLNNLGALYDDMHSFDAAKGAYEEAVDIYRKLATKNPLEYRPNLAIMLGNLSALYRDMHDFTKAEVAGQEAIAIEHQLAEQNPAGYRPDLAMALNNLGTVYNDTSNFDAAEVVLKEAADI
jgi:Tetratricopeptide repeat